MALPEASSKQAKPALAIIALCLGAFLCSSIYERHQSAGRVRKGGSWFDLDSAGPDDVHKTYSSITPTQPRSSLEMVKPVQGLEGPKTGGPAAVQNPGQPSPPSETAAKEATFKEACRASEAKLEALARDYTARYPIIAQYGRDWMSYPDLKKLNDDYMRDRDPVKFIRGLAGSKNFIAMFQKYAVQPAVQSFAMDAMRQSPPATTALAVEFVNKDKDGKSLLQRFGQTLGLPPTMLDPDAAPMDQKAVLDWVAKNNPEVAKAMSAVPPDKLTKQAGKN